MKWRFRKRQQPPPGDADEAREARERAEQALREAREEGHEARSIARRLKAQREENHFSQLILAALREGR
jgi:hypothetical protein